MYCWKEITLRVEMSFEVFVLVNIAQTHEFDVILQTAVNV
jgi:hypothetical protein